jgi:SRSO17 transposase
VRCWIIDDTGFPKQGEHSVGVTRQYCGQLGKQDNCQVAVSLSVANDHASLPIAYRLYLPETWAGDPERRARAGVPEEIDFETKPEIALGAIRAALAEDIPQGMVLGDAGYGVETAFRAALTVLDLTYVLGVQSRARLSALRSTGQSPSIGRERKSPTRSSISAQSRETWLLETPSRPMARTRSSTERVEMPWTQASWITAVSAFSAVRPGSRKAGK